MVNATSLTTVANQTNIVSFIQAVNTELMQNVLGLCILVVISSIAFLSFLSATQDARKAFAGASFIALGVSFLLSLMQLLYPIVFPICLVLTAASVAFARTD